MENAHFNNNKPTILVTNDDGITAGGIQALIDAVKPYGNIVVVAPDKPQSAMGHAVTLSQPLRLSKVNIFGDAIEAYACSGTPVDCVKLAVDIVLEKRPDLCVSGVNHGSNSSINIIYSGTVSAAMEAAMEGIPAAGFSLLDYSADANMEPAKTVVKKVVEQVLKNGIAKNKLLNVNIPKLPLEDIKGYKICRQSKARWNESFDHRQDPTGRDYFWLTGNFNCEDLEEDTDEFALRNGYVSIVPAQYDLTAYKEVKRLQNEWDI